MKVATDAHGWKRSAAYGSDYALTENRKSLMKQAIAFLHCEVILHIAQEQWESGAMVTRDVSDMMEVFAEMLAGNMQAAIEKWRNLDTAAREKYPQWLSEMAGCHINPAFWIDEESLNSTH